MKNNIETAVRERKTEEARKLIQIFLRNEKRSQSAKIEAADWLRRLGLYRDGYLLVAPKAWSFHKALTDAAYSQQLFWSARFLNLQGSTDYALKIISQLKPKAADEFLIAGNIHLTALEFSEALSCFQKYFSLTKNKTETYAMKLTRVSMADAYSGLEKYDEALKVLKTIDAESSEKNLKGILLQAEGEYLARRGDFEEAYKVLMKAFGFFPREDQTPDVAFLHKWLGYAMAALQPEEDDAIDEEIESHFLKAILFLRKPDMRPEMWLDCWYRMFEVGYLNEEKQLQMSVYPGLLPNFVNREGFLDLVEVGSEKAPLRLYPYRDEYQHEGVLHFGMPRELRLLAMLRFAGEWGISLERLKSLIWPDEVSAFIQLEARIFQLLKRLQKLYRIHTSVENGMVRLAPEALNQVWAEYSKKPLRLSFFEKHKSFDSTEFAEYYQLGRTIAFKYLSRFVEHGALTKKKLGKRIVYEVGGSI
jgi:tetratricopeptide (TPR) repeat protein